MRVKQNHASRPPTGRGAATRARILEAASDLIYAQGVGRTSLDDVMAASHASKSQLYHYFADKDALVLEVIGRQSERVLEAQRPYLETMDSRGAFKAWRNAILRLNKPGLSAGCPLGSLAAELANESEPARLRIADAFSLWRERIETGLTRMQSRGELIPSAKPRDLAFGLLAAFQGGVLLAKTTRSQRPLAIALDMAIDHVVRHMTVV